jgi:hypothetical protein
VVLLLFRWNENLVAFMLVKYKFTYTIVKHNSTVLLLVALLKETVAGC